MTRVRIIGIGNPLHPGDDAGARVCDALRRRPLPPGVEVIDGGLAGLDLLPLLEGADEVILADTVAGFGPQGQVMVLDEAALGAGEPPAYGHAGGLAYLLRVLPAVCAGPLPRITMVGVEGPASAEAIGVMADRCLEVAVGRQP